MSSDSRAEEVWAITKAPHTAEAYARNLAKLRIEDAVRPDDALDGLARYEASAIGPAVIVAPGHNLPDVIPDGVRFVVNSGVAVALARGVVPDYVVCRESIDMSSCFEPIAEAAKMPDPWDGKSDDALYAVVTARTVALRLRDWMPTALLDIQSSPKTWETCERLGIPVRWFVPASMQTFHAAETLGVRPVYAGQTSVTAAIALAEFMGFTEIVLAGCARVYARDGYGCVKDAGWGGILEAVEQVTIDGETFPVGTIGGRKRQAELHAAAGQRPPLKRERLATMTRLDGSVCYTTEGLADGAAWMERFAARHPHVRFVQLGAEEDIGLRGFVGGLPARGVSYPDGTTLTPSAGLDGASALRIRERNAVDRVLAVTAATLDGSRVVEVPGLIDGPGVVSTHYAGNRGLVKKNLGNDPRLSLPPMMEVMRQSAEKIGEIVRE